MISFCRHSERSEAKRNAVEESREPKFKVEPRDPSTPLGMTGMSL
jgi:hypothetical protein